MPDLAVGHEVHQLMLDRRNSYPPACELDDAGAVQDLRPLQQTYLPRREKQLSVKIDLARPAPSRRNSLSDPQDA